MESVDCFNLIHCSMLKLKCKKTGPIKMGNCSTNHARDEEYIQHQASENKTINPFTILAKKLNLIKPECPVCLTKVSKYVRLKSCDHLICDQCFRGYVTNDLKNLSKYPLRCFELNCNQLLDHQDVAVHAFNNDEKQLSIFNTNCVKCAIPEENRETCPKCDTTYFYQWKWATKSIKQPFQWIDNDQRPNCVGCKEEFVMFYRHRHHCRICGDVFCDACTSHTLPLSAASRKMLKLWVKHEKAPQNLMTKAMQYIAPTSDLQLKNIIDEKQDVTDAKSPPLMRQNSSELRLTESDKELIDTNKVRSCRECWLDFYRACCNECGFVYCMQCKEEWHDTYDCDDVQRNNLKKQLNDAKAMQLMLDEGYRQCPGCATMIEKNTGCNHMTHHGCSNPNEVDASGPKTHFCYCCGALLFGVYHNEERYGTVHFENGIFEPCIRNNKAKKERKKQKQKQQNEIDNLVDNNTDDCIVM
eukprot:689423_1